MKELDIVRIAVQALDSKKAEDIEVVGIEKLTTLGDYLVIASGASSTQVRALADEVEDKLAQVGVEPHHIEGRSTSWVLLDYETVMVHVFYKEARNFYALERLWNDGQKLDTTEFLQAEEEDGSEGV